MMGLRFIIYSIVSDLFIPNNLANIIINRALGKEKQPPYPTATLSDESLKYIVRTLKEHYPNISVDETSLRKAESREGMSTKETKTLIFFQKVQQKETFVKVLPKQYLTVIIMINPAPGAALFRDSFVVCFKGFGENFWYFN